MTSRGLVGMAERLNALEIAVVVETAGLNTSSTNVYHAMCIDVCTTLTTTLTARLNTVVCVAASNLVGFTASSCYMFPMVTFDHILSAVGDNN